MSRKAPLISLPDFKTICERKLFDDGVLDNDLLLSYHKVNEDLSKIEFDWENYEWEVGYNRYPCGYEILKNGLPVLFINAGGDWEFPICLCIYWDGKKLRAYIPKEGNVYNKKDKRAYGNGDPEDNELEDTENEKLNDLVDAEAIRQDIINKIQIINGSNNL